MSPLWHLVCLASLAAADDHIGHVGGGNKGAVNVLRSLKTKEDDVKESVDSVVSAPAPAPAEAEAPAGSPAGAPKYEGPSDAELQAELDEMHGMLDAEKEMFNSHDPAAKLREELASLIWLEDELKDQWAALGEDAYTTKIGVEQQMVAKETDMPQTAEMLGNMRREMHKYASPFYRKVLEDQIAELQLKQKDVSEEIAHVMNKGKDKKVATEKKEKEEVKKEPKKAQTEAHHGEHEPPAEEPAEESPPRWGTWVWTSTVTLMVSVLAFALCMLWFVFKG